MLPFGTVVRALCNLYTKEPSHNLTLENNTRSACVNLSLSEVPVQSYVWMACASLWVLHQAVVYLLGMAVTSGRPGKSLTVVNLYRIYGVCCPVLLVCAGC